MQKPWLQAAVSLALFLGAPGLPAYQAAAQVAGFRAAAVPNAAGWTQALGALAAGLESSPASATPLLTRTLGQLRLELVFAPKSPAALSLVGQLRASSPAAFAALPLAERAALAEAAIRAAASELAAPAAELVADAKRGRLGEDGKQRLLALESAWFYLEPALGAELRAQAKVLHNDAALAFGRRVADALGRPKEDKLPYLLTLEAGRAFKGAERLLLERPDPKAPVSERFVRDVLAPAVSRSLELGAERVAERGHSTDDLWKGVFRTHEIAFGAVAPRALAHALQRSGVWTDFVAAVSLHAAERLAASEHEDSKETLREAGWRTAYQFRLPSWDPRANEHATFGAWLAAAHGAPKSDPADAWGKPVGTVLGIPLRIEAAHARLMAIMGASFFVVMSAFVPGASLATHLAQAALGTVLMQVSTILHELGHAFTAKAFGEPVVALALTGKGGGAVIYSNMRRPLVDFLVSAAGPLVTLLWAIGFLAAMIYSPASWLTPVYSAQAAISFFNLFMNVFPIVPNDGGRMLRAALAKVYGDHYRANRAASYVGVALAAALALAGVPAYMLLGLGPALAFVFVGIAVGRGAWKSRIDPGTRMFDEASRRG
ncbi:MAG: M50 family metallopeptidase [Elusimicrobia bacterium]|nr:M50 family metallopeptidase [Elusimicrobiota bacterium]